MAIIWNKLIPRWGGDIIEPPEAKKDTGYIAGDKPPAKWENWLRKGTYEALDETRDIIEGIDSQLAQMAFKGCLVKCTVNQSISNTTLTTIIYDSSVYNDKNIWSSLDPSKLVVPAGVSKVRLMASSAWASNSIGYRFLSIQKNGGGFAGQAVKRMQANDQSEDIVLTPVINVSPGDYFQLKVYQDSGVAINFQGSESSVWFSLEVVE